MLCQRCGGLMVMANVRYLMEEEFRKEVETTRCINCGNLEDSVIRSNRSASHGPSDIEPNTVGTGKSNAVRTDSLDRALLRAGALTVRSHTRVPRFPIAPHSINTRARETARSTRPTSNIQNPRG
jgi:hypothetical protein